MGMNIAIATLLGFLSGLGAGGGSLLILWLTLWVGIPQAEARVLNLLFFLPSALIACLFRWKQGKLKIRFLWLPMAVGCITAAGLTYFSAGWDTGLLQKLFGGLLLFTGIRELTYKQKKASP